MSAPAAPAGGAGWRDGLVPVRRATALVLWQAAPWVLLVLVVTSLLGAGSTAWSTWSRVPGGATVIVQGDGGVAGGVSFFVGVASLFSWSRTTRAAVPVLVAGGVTRRAATGGLLVGAVALAAAATVVLTGVATAGGALQRVLAARSAAAPSSGGDAYSSSLTLRHDAPGVLFDPAQTFPWLLLAALAGMLVGAAWYRWRAGGVVGALAGLAAAGAVWLRVVSGSVSGAATSEDVIAAVGSPVALVAPALLLAVAVRLVLRRVPLRPPAR